MHFFITGNWIQLGPVRNGMRTSWNASRSFPYCSQDKWRLIFKVHHLVSSSLPCSFNKHKFYSCPTSGYFHHYSAAQKSLSIPLIWLTLLPCSVNNHVCSNNDAHHFRVKFCLSSAPGNLSSSTVLFWEKSSLRCKFSLKQPEECQFPDHSTWPVKWDLEGLLAVCVSNTDADVVEVPTVYCLLTKIPGCVLLYSRRL